MEKITVNGYDTLIWEGLTIRASSDGRIEIDLPGATEIHVRRLYVQPLSEVDPTSFFCTDHNTGKSVELLCEPE